MITSKQEELKINFTHIKVESYKRKLLLTIIYLYVLYYYILFSAQSRTLTSSKCIILI